VHAILTVQYLVLEIERVTKLPPTNDELSARFGRALREIGFPDVAREEGWASFVEMHKYRDAVNHPKEENIYGTDDGSWQHVPLAWFASGRSIDTSEQLWHFLDQVATRWEQKKKEYDQPTTLTGLKRGIRSLEPAKKPPKH
jgi:hypothetical protein